MEKCIKIDKNISAEKILHLDIQGTFEEKFAICWGLSTVTNFYYEMKKSHKPANEMNLKIILTHNIKTFDSLGGKYPKYIKIKQFFIASNNLTTIKNFRSHCS